MDGVGLLKKAKTNKKSPEKSTIGDKNRQNKKNEGFGWKNQGATELYQRETIQVGESDGRRITHVPPTRRHLRDSC